MKIFKGKKNLFRNVKAAVSFAERSMGLIGFNAMPQGFAMFFNRCNSIHTFFMKFPIDVIMTDRLGKIVLARESLKPWKLAGSFRAVNTLEMKAGSISALKLKVNDILTIKYGS